MKNKITKKLIKCVSGGMKGTFEKIINVPCPNCQMVLNLKEDTVLESCPYCKHIFVPKTEEIFVPKMERIFDLEIEEFFKPKK